MLASPGTSASDAARPLADEAGRRATAELVGRIDRLPPCRATWLPTALVSLAGIFEVYDLYQTAYVLPGLVRSGIFEASGRGLFGLSDQAMFAAMTFLGLFVGATCFSTVADRAGRKTVFIYALLGYSTATALLAVQTSAAGVFTTRFLAGIGLGVDLVTIDAYIVELTPVGMRGRAFALTHFIQYLGVPIVALAAWLLVPLDPLGIAGWRWLVAIGCLGSLLVWYLRRSLPESPRWLALQGRTDEAARIVARMEDDVRRQTGRDLPPALPSPVEAEHRSRLSEIWKPPYAGRTAMLSVFNFFQTIGFFGFTNWLPALLIAKGSDVTQSLLYAFCIACAYPLSSLFWYATVAERFERKWLIVVSALGVACAGSLFAVVTAPWLMILVGIAITACSTLLSLAYHPYQAELFPTQVRARAVGFCYAFSRISTALTSFLVAFALAGYGAPGVFALISLSMLIVVLAIGVFGPRTRGRPLGALAR